MHQPAVSKLVGFVHCGYVREKRLADDITAVELRKSVGRWRGAMARVAVDVLPVAGDVVAPAAVVEALAAVVAGVSSRSILVVK